MGYVLFGLVFPLAHADVLQSEGHSLCSVIYNGIWLMPQVWTENTLGVSAADDVLNGCPYTFYKANDFSLYHPLTCF